MTAGLLAAASCCCAAVSVGSLSSAVAARRGKEVSLPGRRSLTAGETARRFLIAAGGVAGLPAFGVLPAAVMCAVLWLLGGRWQAHRARSYAAAAERDLPALAYSVASALAAGVSVVDALDLASRHSDTRLGRACAAACRRVESGASLEAALAALTREVPGQRLAALCGALISGARHGTSSAGPVSAVARAAASAELERRRERAARSAPLIQLVVALGLVPSVLMIVIAVALARIAS